jgi:ferredoxin
MKVWINQEACHGDGQCADICPDIFFLHDDGVTYLSYVRDVADSGYGPDGEPSMRMRAGLVDVPEGLVDAVVDAAEHCPGACILIEPT